MYGSLREYLKHCQEKMHSTPLHGTQPSSPSHLTHEPAWYRAMSEYMAQRSSRYIEEEEICDCYAENPWNLYRNFDGGQCVFRQHLAHSSSTYYNQQIVNSLELVEPISPCTCDGEEEEQRQLHNHLYYQEQSDHNPHQPVGSDHHHHQPVGNDRPTRQEQHCQHRENRYSSHPLPDCCDGSELSGSDIVNFALQIARGMEHLQRMKVWKSLIT